MSAIDWIVLLGTLVFISVYGIYKSRGNKDMEGYLLGNNSMPWYAVGFSIMATQASAITFLSAPGQAFTDGMRFLQFYFGLPLAMIILCITVVPIYHRLRIYTAYEYLEQRFDLKTRSLAALLFLIQRGIAAGLTIYAPAIILSTLLGWNIYLTNIFIGGLVILYTVLGGTRAVSYTQLGQMTVILSGMAIAAFLLIRLLPGDVSLSDAFMIAGKAGKMNIVELSFDPSDRYNIWSGLIGGMFLALSYFGTDQSQVARYLSGKSVTQSRFGLIMNGLVKIPMQFFILLTGTILYVFYIFQPQPVFHNRVETDKLRTGAYSAQFLQLEDQFNNNHSARENYVKATLHSGELSSEKLRSFEKTNAVIRADVKSLMTKNNSASDTNDTNYIFLDFVIRYLPTGIIGLLIAVIFSASMSSTSSELNALASTSVVDIYKRSINKKGNPRHYLGVSRIATIIWGAVAILVAMFANKLGSLIEAVNILGSLFYGTILGIFLTGFYIKNVGANAVFAAALVAETVVVICYVSTTISFLWYNVIGCVLVALISIVLQQFLKKAGNGTRPLPA
ncbi:MAG TPA: sodium:solute symporter [Bacteroidia bacterium]|nr:sodium:solute symporter [Bacteroidia bacterium]